MPTAEPTTREVVLTALILTAAAMVCLWVLRDNWPQDLSAVYFAGRFYHLGQFDQVYASPAAFFGQDEPPGWIALRAELGHGPAEIFFPYVYPPLWAALAAPVAGRVSPETFFAGAYLVQVALLAGGIVLAWQVMGRPVRLPLWALAGVAMTGISLTGSQALYHCQPQITVAVLTLWAFERYAAGRDSAAGLFLGIAAAIKLTPLMFVLIFLLDRRWRAVGAFAVAGGALALASLAVAPWALHLEFLDKLRLISSQVVFTENNYSLKVLLFLLLQSGPPLDTMAVMINLPAPGWLAPLTGSVTALLVAGLVLATQGLPADRRLAARLPALVALVVAGAPLSWAHQFLVVVLLAPGLLALAPWPRNLLMLVALAVLLRVPMFEAVRLDTDLGRLLPVLLGTFSFLGLAAVFALMRRPD